MKLRLRLKKKAPAFKEPPRPVELPKVEEPKLPEPLKPATFKGTVVPSTVPKGPVPVSDAWKEASRHAINETYPLIAIYKGGPVLAYATISWSQQEQSLVYRIFEPQLTPGEAEQLKRIEGKLEEKLDVDFSVANVHSQQEYLHQQFEKVLDLFGYRVSTETKQKFEYYLYRDFVGYNQIEPLLHDQQIEDVSCDGVDIPVYIAHRNPLYGNLQTNVSFKTKEELDSFTIKVAQRCGKALSVAAPLLDGVLPDGSRVQATLGSDIARRGSNFTIRKFTEHPFTPVDLMNFSTMDANSLAYIWLMIEHGKSILIAGPTATGKTTLLNAISLFIRPELKIVSIEDTGELQLPHPNWIPEVSRAGTGEKGYGAVEMFDLLKSALRQRPDFVIVGEVRGQEANVMFQGMATGHPAMGTIHADNVQKVMDRLVTPPISLSPALLENLDIIIFIIRTRRQGKYVRRCANITEIKGIDIHDARIIPNVVFEWDPITDTFEAKESSIQVQKIMQLKGVKPESMVEELERRADLMRWLQKKHVNDYKLFAYYINRYYGSPQEVMDMIRKESMVGGK